MPARLYAWHIDAMVHGTGIPVRPHNEPQLASWRVGLVAFREAARAGYQHLECSQAGVLAIIAAFPDVTEAGARQAIVDAVGWVTRSEHAEWFRKGVPCREWVWPPSDGDVGLYRRPGSKRP